MRQNNAENGFTKSLENPTTCSHVERRSGFVSSQVFVYACSPYECMLGEGVLYAFTLQVPIGVAHGLPDATWHARMPASRPSSAALPSRTNQRS